MVCAPATTCSLFTRCTEWRIESNNPGLRPLRTHHRSHAHRRKRHGSVGQLHERKIKLRTQAFGVVGIETPLLHVGRHAHNFRREFGLADFQEQRLPIGFSFPKYFRASTSSTTTTLGAFSSSCAVKKRPLRRGVCMIFR